MNVIIIAIIVAIAGTALFRLGLVINSKLKVIHTLVNSNLSLALQAEHDGLIRELAMMREVISLKQLAGNEPTPEALEAIVAIQDRIKILSVQLHDRQNADAIVQSMS